jgi:hypothetical protein
LLFQDAACDLYKQQRGSSFKSFEAWQYLWYQPQVPQKLKEDDRNYTAMHTHVQRSVHLSALLITWVTWGDGWQRRYTSDVALCIVRFPLTVDNSDMN